MLFEWNDKPAATLLSMSLLSRHFAQESCILSKRVQLHHIVSVLEEHQSKQSAQQQHYLACMTPHWATLVHEHQDCTRVLTWHLCSSSERELNCTKSTVLSSSSLKGELETKGTDLPLRHSI